ncbi:MAG: arsenate reductase ArsC, partial [Planctomycetota bacterium]
RPVAPADLIRIAFVCVENANRSQMAEAFGHLANEGDLEIHSAGSKGGGHVNPKAVAAMGRLGYDLSSHRSKPATDLAGVVFDAVVTMGCGDACPFLQARHRLDWPIEDPKHMEPAAFDRVRDEIGQRVAGLVKMLRNERDSKADSDAS